MAEPIVIENARIFWTNFAGQERGIYNPKGKRNFCLELPLGMADNLKLEGWNVKSRAGRDGEEATPYISVEVRFEPIAPRIYLVTSRNMTELDETTVGQLDNADIRNVDLVVTPSRYTDRNTGETRIKAYLKNMYVTIVENPFAAKYADYE